jgi:hypothetical protein
MMKKLMITMAAIGALAVGTPAAAQGWNGNAGYGGGIDAQVEQLQMRLQAGVQRGRISRPEAMQLRQQLRSLSQLERRYSRDGLSRGERQDLQRRIQDLRQRLQIAERGGYGRDGRGYDRDDNGYDRDDRDGGRYDRDDDRNDRDGYDRDDDRDDRNDGRWDDRDDRNDSGYLQVGQRATGSLSAVPSQYGTQFRDGGGVYYRYGGGQVYQIDARTNLVLRVYPIRR